MKAIDGIVVAMRSTIISGAALLLMGCENVPQLPHHTKPVYRFLLGPKPKIVGDADDRVFVDAPSKFIELDREPSDKPMELSEFTFAYRYPEVEPVRRDQLAEPNVVIATVGWEPPGSVQHRIDGSWQNYYSRYKVRHEDKYGLHASVGDDEIDTSVLYYSISDEVLIECNSIRNESLTSCHMIKKIAPNVALEMRFPARLLSDWRRLIATSSSIISINSK